jgi:hypothetical protein
MSVVPTMAQINPAEALAREYFANKAEADRLTARNREIATRFESMARFKDGSATGHVEADGFKISVSRKVSIKWDQERLAETRRALTDEIFFKIFNWEFKPKSKKDVDAFLNLASADFRAPLLAAMTTSPAATQIKIEEV